MAEEGLIQEKDALIPQLKQEKERIEEDCYRLKGPAEP